MFFLGSKCLGGFFNFQLYFFVFYNNKKASMGMRHRAQSTINVNVYAPSSPEDADSLSTRMQHRSTANMVNDTDVDTSSEASSDDGMYMTTDLYDPVLVEHSPRSAYNDCVCVVVMMLLLCFICLSISLMAICDIMHADIPK